MKISNYFKKIINRIKFKKHLLLDSPKNIYSDLIQKPEISNIIDNMPENLSQIEKAYYLYIELGKIVTYDHRFYVLDRRQEIYNNNVDDSYSGICKSLSELYVNILKDPRIGISADLVKTNRNSSISHVDVILKIDGKNYFINIVGDLSHIKTSSRINYFCSKPTLAKYLKDYYGEISYLSRQDLEKMDKKLGYSFFVPKVQSDDERGIYNDDTIEMFSKELNDPQKFRKYVLHNKNIPKEEHLKYKVNYVLDNINNITEFSGNIKYDEITEYYRKILRKSFSPEEQQRIKVYALIDNNDLLNVMSIIKLKPLPNSKSKNTYYLYSNEEKRYVEKSSEELKEFINQFDKDSLRLTNFNFQQINEDLELE